MTLLFASSCTKKDDIGSEAFPEDNKSVVISDSLELLCYTLKDAIGRTDENVPSLVGTFKDPVFGKSSAELYAQFVLPLLNYKFKNTVLIADSVILTLSYTGFQGDAKSLPQKINVYALTQCCFNVVPKLTIKLTYLSGGQTKTVVIDEIKPDNCGWVNYTKYIAPWEGNDGGKATISISLDESGIGDGNDFVVDNIFLTELQPIDKSITNSVSVTPSGNGNIVGNFTGTLPAGTGFSWSIVTLDADGQSDVNCPEVANPQTWWTATTNFPGFDGCKLNGNTPGKLLPGKTYKIVFGTFGPCNAWDAVVFTCMVDPATGKMKLLKKEYYVQDNEPVLKKGKYVIFPPRDL